MLDVCSWCPGLVDLRVRHLVDGCESRARSCARHVLSASCFSALVVRRPAMYGLVWGGLRAQADFRSIDWHLACCVVCSPCSVQQWARDRLGLAGACRAPTVCLARLPLALVQCRTSWQVVPQASKDSDFYDAIFATVFVCFSDAGCGGQRPRAMGPSCRRHRGHPAEGVWAAMC